MVSKQATFVPKIGIFQKNPTFAIKTFETFKSIILQIFRAARGFFFEESISKTSYFFSNF